MKNRKRRRLIFLSSIIIALTIIVLNLSTNKPQDAVATVDENPYYAEAGRDDLKDGVYRSKNMGFVDNITVEMTVENGRITGFKVLEHNETSQISKRALIDIPYQVYERQSSKVDAISGATETSTGIIQGARDAIRQAGGNPDDY